MNIYPVTDICTDCGDCGHNSCAVLARPGLALVTDPAA